MVTTFTSEAGRKTFFAVTATRALWSSSRLWERWSSLQNIDSLFYFAGTDKITIHFQLFVDHVVPLVVFELNQGFGTFESALDQIRPIPIHAGYDPLISHMRKSCLVVAQHSSVISDFIALKKLGRFAVVSSSIPPNGGLSTSSFHRNASSIKYPQARKVPPTANVFWVAGGLPYCSPYKCSSTVS